MSRRSSRVRDREYVRKRVRSRYRSSDRHSMSIRNNTPLITRRHQERSSYSGRYRDSSKRRHVYRHSRDHSHEHDSAFDRILSRLDAIVGRIQSTSEPSCSHSPSRPINDRPSQPPLLPSSVPTSVISNERGSGTVDETTTEGRSQPLSRTKGKPYRTGSLGCYPSFYE